MRAYEPGYPGVQVLWQRVRPWILARDGHRCSVCGADAVEVDHIWPVSRGGSDHPENLRAICQRCNLDKMADLPGTLPFYLTQPLDPGEALLHRVASERSDEWATICNRLHYAVIAHLNEKGAGRADRGWVDRMDRRGRVANARAKHWDNVARSRLNRATVEARCLDWARELPAVQQQRRTQYA